MADESKPQRESTTKKIPNKWKNVKGKKIFAPAYGDPKKYQKTLDEADYDAVTKAMDEDKGVQEPTEPDEFEETMGEESAPPPEYSDEDLELESFFED